MLFESSELVSMFVNKSVYKESYYCECEHT